MELLCAFVCAVYGALARCLFAQFIRIRGEAYIKMFETRITTHKSVKCCTGTIKYQNCDECYSNLCACVSCARAIGPLSFCSQSARSREISKCESPIILFIEVCKKLQI